MKPPTGGVFVYRVGGFRGRALAKKNKKKIACTKKRVVVSYELQGKLGLRRVALFRGLPNGN